MPELSALLGQSVTPEDAEEQPEDADKPTEDDDGRADNYKDSSGKATTR